MVAYSRAGYGHSPPVALPRPVTYMHDEADVVLPALLDRAGHRAPGARRAQRRCLDRAAVPRPGDGAWSAHRAPHVIVEDISVASIAAARTAYETTDLRAKLARYHDDVDVTFRGWNDVWLSDEFRSWDITDRLPAITEPVLVIQGAADAYGTLRQLDLIEAGVSGPFERLVVDGVGHAPHLEAPDTVLAAIADFVAHV